MVDYFVNPFSHGSLPINFSLLSENRLLNSFIFKSNHLNWSPFPVELSNISYRHSLTPLLCKYSRSPSSYNPCLISSPSHQFRISEKFMSDHIASTFHNYLSSAGSSWNKNPPCQEISSHTQHRLLL